VEEGLMVVFRQADQKIPDGGGVPTPLTWDYAIRMTKAGGYYACQSDRDIALCTCANGHTCRVRSDVHQVDAAGNVTPSYVCPIAGCTFHVAPWRLDGWDPAHVFQTVDIDAT
jgi:hypothetical protein